MEGTRRVGDQLASRLSPHLDHVLGEPHLAITSGTKRVHGSKESRGFRRGVGG